MALLLKSVGVISLVAGRFYFDGSNIFVPGSLRGSESLGLRSMSRKSLRAAFLIFSMMALSIM